MNGNLVRAFNSVLRQVEKREHMVPGFDGEIGPGDRQQGGSGRAILLDQGEKVPDKWPGKRFGAGERGAVMPGALIEKISSSP